MSSIYLYGNQLVQRVGGLEEELGYLEEDPEACVLWLKDTFGLCNAAGSYILASRYTSMAAARNDVLHAPVVSIWHKVWMRNVVKREAEKEARGSKDGIRACIDRLPLERVQDLFQKIGGVAFRQAIIEIIKKQF